MKYEGDFMLSIHFILHCAYEVGQIIFTSDLSLDLDLQSLFSL